MVQSRIKRIMKTQVNKKRGAPMGNEFWRQVKMPGRPKKYNPSLLWKIALGYFEWVGKNPLKEKKVFGNGHSATVPKMRAMTEIAFCLYAGIDENTFRRYKDHEDYKDFWGVSKTIEKLIYTQKFEGAAADLFNASIIARELGLVDRQGLEIDWDNVSEEKLDQLINRMKKTQKK